MEKYGPQNSGAIGTVCIDTDADSTSSHPVCGMVVGVYLKFSISCNSAPTITITTVSDPPVTILAIATDLDGWYYPVTPQHNPADGSVISDQYSRGVPINDFVNVALSDAEEGDSVDVWLMLD
jgi:hypothetical protein